MTQRIWSWTVPAVAMVAAVTALACGDSSKGGGTNTGAGNKLKICSPGVVYECTGGSCMGHQACTADGTAYTQCLCDDTSAQAGVGSAASGTSGGGSEAGNGGSLANSDASTPDAGNDMNHDAGGTTNTQPKCPHGTACVSAPPSDWHGPVAVYAGSAAPPTCADAFAVEAWSGGDDPSFTPATCSACSCTPQSSACASFVDFSTSATPGCGGTACTTSVSASCAEISPPCIAGLSTASLQSKLPSAGGTCTASKQSPKKSTAKFGTRVVACALTDTDHGNCDTHELCAPAPQAPFGAALCIWKAGDVSCPSGDYTKHHVYYQKLHDTRSCSACSCDGPDCSYQWKVFDASDTSCSTPLVSLNSEDQCVQVNPSNDKLRIGASVTGTGDCTPQGGSPTGDVTAEDAVTVCCAQ
ncbi:MAG TPA: hypothetical protein VHM19_23280 [Polyangiales bacterium]|nr:hypothetical protein [Polyangiales bacterium]